MSYSIHAEYRTGDSFGSHDASITLEMVWNDLDKAKAALARIREHYAWYKDRDAWEVRFEKRKPAPEPEWHKSLRYDFCLKVALDNGNEVEFHAPWCGYFERLYGAKIIANAPVDDGMSFEV